MNIDLGEKPVADDPLPPRKVGDITHLKNDKVRKVKNESIPVFNLQKESFDTISINIPLSGKRLASLTIPDDFTNADIDRISKFVEALRTSPAQ